MRLVRQRVLRPGTARTPVVDTFRPLRAGLRIAARLVRCDPVAEGLVGEGDSGLELDRDRSAFGLACRGAVAGLQQRKARPRELLAGEQRVMATGTEALSAHVRLERLW